MEKEAAALRRGHYYMADVICKFCHITVTPSNATASYVFEKAEFFPIGNLFEEDSLYKHKKAAEKLINVSPQT